MTIEYTTARGITYYLVRRAAAGRVRFALSRSKAGELADRVPEGFEIRESPDGTVSLVRSRPQRVRALEIRLVEARVERHPRREDFRVEVQPDRIVVHERVGIASAELIAEITRLAGGLGLRFGRETAASNPGSGAGAQPPRFMAVLRFILTDDAQRLFRVQRIDGRRWGDVVAQARLTELPLSVWSLSDEGEATRW